MTRTHTLDALTACWLDFLGWVVADFCVSLACVARARRVVYEAESNSTVLLPTPKPMQPSQTAASHQSLSETLCKIVPLPFVNQDN